MMTDVEVPEQQPLLNYSADSSHRNTNPLRYSIHFDIPLSSLIKERQRNTMRKFSEVELKERSDPRNRLESRKEITWWRTLEKMFYHGSFQDFMQARLVNSSEADDGFGDTLRSKTTDSGDDSDLKFHSEEYPEDDMPRLQTSSEDESEFEEDESEFEKGRTGE
jgi:hypothetical protein